VAVRLARVAHQARNARRWGELKARELPRLSHAGMASAHTDMYLQFLPVT